MMDQKILHLLYKIISTVSTSRLYIYNNKRRVVQVLFNSQQRHPDNLGLLRCLRQQRLGDNLSLDLRRSLVDLVDLGVAHQLLDGVL